MLGFGAALVPMTGEAAPKGSSTSADASRAAQLQRRSDELYESGDLAQALPLMEEACSILEQTSAPARVLATCLSSLAALRFKQGQHSAAIELAERAVRLHEKARRRDDSALVKSLVELAIMYEHQARYDEAERLFERALALGERALGPDHIDVAKALNGLAAFHAARGAYARARPLYERALEIRERVLGPSHPSVGMVLNNLGALHQDLGDHATAIGYYERALAIFEAVHGAEHVVVAVICNNLGSLYHERADYERAASYYERSLAIREKVLAPGHADVAVVLLGLARTERDRGDYERAEALLERALAIAERALGPEHPRVATILTELGRLAKELGRYGRAEQLYLRASSIRERTLGREHPDFATTLNNLASLYVEQGEYGRAEARYLQARAILERVLGPEHRDVATLVNNLGLVYDRQGEHEKAEAHYRRALELREEQLGPVHPLVAQSLDNLARLHVQQGEYERALPLHERARSIRVAALGPRHADVAISASNLAAVHAARGDLEAARVLLEEALSILEETLGPEHAKVAAVVGELGALHARRGDHAEAERLHERALAIMRVALRPGHPRLATALMRLAGVRQALGRHDSALELYRRALDIEEQNLSEALVIAEDTRRLAYATKLFGSTHDVLSFHLQGAPDDRRAAELAVTTLLRRKGRIQELVGRSYAVLRRSLPAEHQRDLDELSRVRGLYTALVHRGPAGGDVEAHRARLVALERRQDALWATLAAHSPQARALIEPVTLREVQSRLPSDAALVEYASYRASTGSAGAGALRYAAYVVFPDRLEWVDLGPAAIIDARASALREAIVRQAAAEAPARALHGSIVRPVIDRLGTTSRVFIAPDGELDLVPFDALVDEHGHYAIERLHLHYLVSGRDLLRPWALEPTAPGPALLAANPLGARLPGTELEASMLAALLGDAVLLQHEDATEARLRAHERPRIVHLATHGSFGTDRNASLLSDAAAHGALRSLDDDDLPPTQLGNPMLYAWLELAIPPGNERAEHDPDAEDGKLTAYEVSGWDLRGTELVTLSACDTARGRYQQGEGVLGLRRAFAVAGARTQVMSLWRVADATTALMMESYYRRLLAGEGRSEAMRNTQLELLRSPATRHPYDWAAFVVVGEWEPLAATTRASTGPEPIPPRPRGCQASLGPPAGHPCCVSLLLLLLWCARRRE